MNAALHVYWPDARSDVDPRLLDLVLPHCSRWRTLCFDIDFPFSTYALNWLQPLKGRLSRLEQLKVVGGAYTETPDVLSAPNLTAAILTGRHLGTSPLSIVTPWGQMTHYRGTYTPMRRLEILRAAPNLRECVLGFDKYKNYRPLQTPLIILPHLRRFCIYEPTFLVHLAAPSLEELLMSMPYQPFTDLLPFIHRSSGILKKKTRDVGDEQDQVTFFDAMAISGAASDLCPNITSIVYGYHYCLFMLASRD